MTQNLDTVNGAMYKHLSCIIQTDSVANRKRCSDLVICYYYAKSAVLDPVDVMDIKFGGA